VAAKASAGILLYRRAGAGIEVLLAHPGGPYFAGRDQGAWTIPKGEIEAGEVADAVARREFEEETGHPVPDGSLVELGTIRQKGGKIVTAWAVEGDLDPATARSNTFPLEWPPRSRRFVETPEIDRVEWFAPEEARRRIKDTQVPFIDRLLGALGYHPVAPGP
jgi:predicted NUDIX family NTP pyrophosphohydrolase